MLTSLLTMKKAQIHMTETIAVLFIFFILLVFGLIFYAQFQKGAIKEKQEELFAKRSMETALQVLFLPELVCSERSLTEDNCFDLRKAEAIVAERFFYGGSDEEHTREERERRDYYFSIFSYATIKIHQLPVNSGEVQKEYVLYDYPKLDFTKSQPAFFVIALKEGSDTYHFAYLNVTIYS